MPRTTLTLEPDVAAELDRRRRERGTSLKQEVNELLRTGMSLGPERARKGKQFKTRPLPLGKPRLESFDDIGEILALAEGEEHR